MYLDIDRLMQYSPKQRWGYLTDGANPVVKKKFVEFHRNNPHIYQTLVDRIHRQMQNGWRRTSVWLLLNIERWGPGSTVDHEEQYKISNDYFAYYARLLIARHPEFASMLEIKRLQGQDSIEWLMRGYENDK